MTAGVALGDRRRAALARSDAMRRHPTRRSASKPVGPPPAAYFVIRVIVLVFTLLGLVMVLSATSISEFHRGNSPWRIVGRQAMWAGIGVFALVVVSRVPMHSWRRLVNLFLVVALAAMALPFVPGIGREVNDARAWIQVGPVSIQPSEFLKLAVLLAAAALLSARRDEMMVFRRTMWPVLVMTGIGAAMCLAQKDLGSAIVLAGVALAVLYIAGAPLTLMFAATLASAAVAGLFVITSDRRIARFTAFLDVATHKDRYSYQTYQAMIGMAQGGFTGSGIGRGDNKLGEFLPLAHSDFIFAVIAEELGLIGIVAVLGGFVMLAYAGVQVALATQDRFHSLVAGGIVGWLVVQTVINVGGVVGLMPVTGLTLPFFSAGGSSLFVTLVSAGLLLNVARNVR